MSPVAHDPRFDQRRPPKSVSPPLALGLGLVRCGSTWRPGIFLGSPLVLGSATAVVGALEDALVAGAAFWLGAISAVDSSGAEVGD